MIITLAANECNEKRVKNGLGTTKKRCLFSFFFSKLIIKKQTNATLFFLNFSPKPGNYPIWSNEIFSTFLLIKRINNLIQSIRKLCRNIWCVYVGQFNNPHLLDISCVVYLIVGSGCSRIFILQFGVMHRKIPEGVQ